MVMSMTTSSTEVTVEGEIQIDAKTGVLITGIAAGAGVTTTIGTVGAGKIWNIRAITMVQNANGAGGSTGTVKLAGVDVMKIMLGSSAGSSANATQTITFPSDTKIELASGETIQIYNATAIGSTTASVLYIEE